MPQFPLAPRVPCFLAALVLFCSPNVLNAQNSTGPDPAAAPAAPRANTPAPPAKDASAKPDAAKAECRWYGVDTPRRILLSMHARGAAIQPSADLLMFRKALRRATTATESY